MHLPAASCQGFSRLPLKLAIAAALLAAPVCAHATSLKWIEPTAAERAMTAEPKAPGAAAILLSYEETDDANSYDITVHARIKVLTSAGLEAGTVQIPHPQAYGNYLVQEFVGRTIHADGSVAPFTDNLENTPTTVIPGRGLARVILMPNVQAGSIVEYAYHIGNRYPGLHRLRLQHVSTAQSRSRLGCAARVLSAQGPLQPEASGADGRG